MGSTRPRLRTRAYASSKTGKFARLNRAHEQYIPTLGGGGEAVCPRRGLLRLAQIDRRLELLPGGCGNDCYLVRIDAEQINDVILRRIRQCDKRLGIVSSPGNLRIITLALVVTRVASGNFKKARSCTLTTAGISLKRGGTKSGQCINCGLKRGHPPRSSAPKAICSAVPSETMGNPECTSAIRWNRWQAMVATRI